MTEIMSFGGYVLRHHLVRKSMFAANAWANPPLKADGGGVRRTCN